MMSLLSRMTRNLTLAIPVAMLLGLVYGLIGPTDWLQALIVSLTLLMVYPMMNDIMVAQIEALT